MIIIYFSFSTYRFSNTNYNRLFSGKIIIIQYSFELSRQENNTRNVFEIEAILSTLLRNWNGYHLREVVLHILRKGKLVLFI